VLVCLEWRHDTQHNDTRHKNTPNYNNKTERSAKMTLSIMLLVVGLSVAFLIVMLSVVMLSGVAPLHPVPSNAPVSICFILAQWPNLAYVIKLFFGHNLRMFVISLSVCHWRAFPA
jgi:hypothetical protein